MKDPYFDKPSIVLFPIGFTVGIDVKEQKDKVIGVICLSKYSIEKENLNNTNLKDFL
jgi:hypothetical protein